MRYQVIGSDYDGTLAEWGRVAPATLAALERLEASGRKFVLVTGRRLDDLQQIFPRYALCDRIVAENGAVLFSPATGELEVLAEAPPVALLEKLRAVGVPFGLGRVIVATETVHLASVQCVLAELAIDWEPILNKDALMLLPRGVDKASGFRAALRALGIDPAASVGVGDAENDLPLLRTSGIGVAVDNALPELKRVAGWVTPRGAGEGMVDLIQALITDDLAALNA
jgi:hydroxymethylpyrimidine pyrophosphatase-like HAD family hydrolase